MVTAIFSLPRGLPRPRFFGLAASFAELLAVML
jgi:hypothetical protein